MSAFGWVPLVQRHNERTASQLHGACKRCLGLLCGSCHESSTGKRALLDLMQKFDALPTEIECKRAVSKACI